MSKMRSRSKINDLLDDHSHTEKRKKPAHNKHSSDQDNDEKWFNKIDDYNDIPSSEIGEP